MFLLRNDVLSLINGSHVLVEGRPCQGPLQLLATCFLLLLNLHHTSASALLAHAGFLVPTQILRRKQKLSLKQHNMQLLMGPTHEGVKLSAQSDLCLLKQVC